MYAFTKYLKFISLLDYIQVKKKGMHMQALEDEGVCVGVALRAT